MSIHKRINNHFFIYKNVTGLVKIDHVRKCKLHLVIFSLISSIQNVVSHFHQLQKTAH